SSPSTPTPSASTATWSGSGTCPPAPTASSPAARASSTSGSTAPPSAPTARTWRTPARASCCGAARPDLTGTTSSLRPQEARRANACGHLRGDGCDEARDRDHGNDDDQRAQHGGDRLRHDGQVLGEQAPSPPPGADPRGDPEQKRRHDDGDGQPRDGRPDLPTDEPERFQDRK